MIARDGRNARPSISETALIRRPAAIIWNAGVGARARIKVLRSRIDQSVTGVVGRSDLEDAAAIPTIVGQTEVGRRNCRIRCRDYRRLAGQTAIVKGSKEVADVRGIGIGRPQVFLTVGLVAFGRG